MFGVIQMLRELQRYLGKKVELIYMDRSGRITQRKVQLHSLRGGRAKVFCLERQAPRILLIENILAVLPVMGRVV
jgi:predicted DNA-binding transcriptional regulator YafY